MQVMATVPPRQAGGYLETCPVNVPMSPTPAEPTPCERVFLIGPRGSGKTTVARLLAAALGWQWCDADAELERAAGRTIREIFAAEGEAGFRDREAAVLAELCQRPRCVIATGGGVVLRPGNRERLRRHGLVAWLTADVETLCVRLDGDATTASRRPALTGAASAAAPEEVAAVLAAREPLYRECADLALDTARQPPEQVVAALVAAVQRGPHA
jgi:shikimate kinase